MLDLAVGAYVHRRAVETGQATSVAGLLRRKPSDGADRVSAAGRGSWSPAVSLPPTPSTGSPPATRGAHDSDGGDAPRPAPGGGTGHGGGADDPRRPGGRGVPGGPPVPGCASSPTHAVGLHTSTREACAARGVQVTNTPGVLTDSTADLTMALLLGAARRIGEGERNGPLPPPPGTGHRTSCSGWNCPEPGSASSGWRDRPGGGPPGAGLRPAHRLSQTAPRSPTNTPRARRGARWRRLLAESALLVVTARSQKQTRNLLDARRLPCCRPAPWWSASPPEWWTRRARRGPRHRCPARSGPSTTTPTSRPSTGALARTGTCAADPPPRQRDHPHQAGHGAPSPSTTSLAVLDGRRPPTPA
ncbi:hypothetical protein [Streptomyces hydrogenans]|uniref:hypothetical protein n=1 Tax=Streptomyces hydrogenans TaxID=1873719 RepID=UPI001CFE06A8